MQKRQPEVVDLGILFGNAETLVVLIGRILAHPMKKSPGDLIAILDLGTSILV
jgi:hypothetical protein